MKIQTRRLVSFSLTVLVMLALMWPHILSAKAEYTADFPNPQTLSADLDIMLAADSNIRLQIVRADLWLELPDSVVPEEDAFLVLLGYIAAGEQKACIGKSDIGLQIEQRVYDLSNRQGTAKDTYDTDYPGPLRDQCVSSGESKPTTLVFDIALDGNRLSLQFLNRVYLLPFTLSQLISGGVPTPVPSSTPTITSTPSPTSTTTPTATAGVVLLPHNTPAIQLPQRMSSSLDRYAQLSQNGLSFTLYRFDIWQKTPEGNSPSNDQFLVVIGTFNRNSDVADTSYCIRADEIEVSVAGQIYSMATSHLSDFKSSDRKRNIHRFQPR